MNKKATVHVRIEPDVKQEAEKILSILGLSPSQAINILYRQIMLRGEILFKIDENKNPAD